MQDVLYIEQVDQAAALLKPQRLAIMRRLAEPRSCPELAAGLGAPVQRVYYHVKILEKAGLVDKVAERRVGGIMEGLYRATARSYWLSPHLVGRVGGPRQARDQLSQGFLLTLAEELQDDLARLARAGGDEPPPTLGLAAQITLRDGAERAAFLAEVQATFQSLARKYGGDAAAPGQPFRLLLACYPMNWEGRGEK